MSLSVDLFKQFLNSSLPPGNIAATSLTLGLLYLPLWAFSGFVSECNAIETVSTFLGFDVVMNFSIDGHMDSIYELYFKQI